MRVSMIVSDLDGTLLRSDKTISDYTVSIFECCRARGIKLVFATGRPIRAVTAYHRRIPCDGAVYHNGAVAENDGVVLLRCGIPPEATNDILSAVLKVDPAARVCLEIEDRLYGNFDASDIWPGVETVYTEFTDLPRLFADKILLPMSTKEELDAAARVLPREYYIQMSENTVGMIMNRGATKRNAVRALSARFDIPMSQIAAFGDDYNDVEMLRDCGVGVAVENAIQEARDAAGFVCGANDSDGVARWIEENILL
ncbi:MAG: HAD family hydrolase [Clostridiaceae bacterium]|nr:HAD family hydrolase [Clostridiaceae bacterium]